MLEAQEQKGVTEEQTVSTSPSNQKRRRETDSQAKAEKQKNAGLESVVSSNKKKPKFESLNESFASELAPPQFGTSPSKVNTGGLSTGERTVEEIIAAKKEKKHKRKQELRMAKKKEELSHLDEQLKTLTDKKGKKAKAAALSRDALYEKQLEQMQKEKALEEKKRKQEEKQERNKTNKGLPSSGAPNDDDLDASTDPSTRRERISFTEEDEGEDGGLSEEHHALRFPTDTKERRKVKDFHELVDIVRFGERVEAPPVFDVVPNKEAAVTKLAVKLERDVQQQERQRKLANRKANETRNSSNALSQRLNHSVENERVWLLSGGGKAGEQKRLARLGLAPAATQKSGHVHHAADDAAQRKLTKEKEMELLRQSVMATYQRNRRKEVQSKKGVDMKHEFPRFE